MRYIANYHSPLGPMLLSADETGLTGLWFRGQKYFARGLCLEPREEPRPVFDQTRSWLDSYFAGEEPGFTPVLHLLGTPFQRLVWSQLLSIPRGESRTYGQLAREVASLLGKPSMSAQAVGCAVGHNPVSVIVPCHRVLGQDGSLTGYAGGLWRKRRLLILEGLLRPEDGTETAQTDSPSSAAALPEAESAAEASAQDAPLEVYL